MMYNEKVMEYFNHPKNFGKIDDPDGVGKVGNVTCGDVMWIYIKVGKKRGKEIIEDIKFKTFGCVSAIATSSMVTELAMGKTIEQALKINKKKIVDKLGGLPPIKVHCSVLANDALDEAIYNYLKRKNRPIPPELEKRHLHNLMEREEIEKKHPGWEEKTEKFG